MSPVLAERVITGWDASLRMQFTGTPVRTELHRTHAGPLRIQRPFYPEGKVCHVYVLHPPGGVVSGDTLTIEAIVEKDAAALITTPGATKFYRSSGRPGKQTQLLTVAGGTLEWFPQENILFDGCDSRLDTTISITQGAKFMGWEIQCYGRPAAGEVFKNGRATNKMQILIDGVPVLVERTLVDEHHSIDRISGMRSQASQGIFVATVENPELVNAIREIPSMTDEFFTTSVDGLTLVRYLGSNVEKAKAVFVDVWSLLRPVVLGKPARIPRIWAT